MANSASMLVPSNVAGSMFLEAPDGNHLSLLVVKVTHRCNLKCVYCYENITKGADMKLETFQRLVDVTVGRTALPKITFTFHGGEPTLMGPEWFSRAFTYASEIGSKKSVQVNFDIQSNLVNLPDKLLDLFVEWKVKVGVSLDGPPSLNDRSRGASHQVIRNIHTCKARGLRVGILTTINIINWESMHAIIKYIHEELGENSFKANVSYPVGIGKHLPPLTTKQIVSAQKTILDYMFDTKGNRLIEVNLAEEVLRFASRSVSGLRSPTMCHDHICGAGTRVLGVTPAGDLLPCGRFEWNNQDWKLSDVWSIDDKSTGSKWPLMMQKFFDIARDNWQECSTCKARNICAYACQAFIVRSDQKRNIECEPTRWLFDYLSSRLQDVMILANAIEERNATNRARLGYYDSGYNDGSYNDGSYKDVYSDGPPYVDRV